MQCSETRHLFWIAQLKTLQPLSNWLPATDLRELARGPAPGAAPTRLTREKIRFQAGYSGPACCSKECRAAGGGTLAMPF